MSPPRQIYHRVIFRQGAGQKSRSVAMRLDESYRPDAKAVGGRWFQRKGESEPEGIDLYPNFTNEDKARLRWRWDSAQHGGLLEVGIDTPSEDHKNGKYMWFRVWFSLRGAKRLSSGNFQVVPAYPDGDGVAVYELGGSSDTLEKGSGQWTVRRYE
jgi:hypothetical protein